MTERGRQPPPATSITLEVDVPEVGNPVRYERVVRESRNVARRVDSCPLGEPPIQRQTLGSIVLWWSELPPPLLSTMASVVVL